MESAVKNRVYINGTGCLSPQPTLGNHSFLEELVSEVTIRLKAIDPNYKEFVPPEMVRRMGRIIKMGVAAAKTCLSDPSPDSSPVASLTLAREGSKPPSGGWGVGVPDAIITGTGLGCIEDTEKFLGNMIRNNEEFLTPTSFIQSTHNTVGAQIALLMGCHGYNFTYVHRGFSFESAILDSLIQLESGRAQSILLGAADELTSNSFRIQERMGFWRRKPVDNLTLLENPGRGTIAGEGAAFFLLERAEQPTTYATLDDVEMLFRPNSSQEISGQIVQFLERNKLTTHDIDLLLLGRNGDSRFDSVYDEVTRNTFGEVASCGFKHLCGEYMTASSFGLWLATRILRAQRIPDIVKVERKPSGLRHILLYNHYRGINHSMILLSKA
ncbi:MAG: 3-oxoacyl-ACP synthase [Bacteroidetes bacterium]|nr:MAG: 3-oxoacyl-ACP synthase [Bacteroidota bacterium]